MGAPTVAVVVLVTFYMTGILASYTDTPGHAALDQLEDSACAAVGATIYN